jgi:predicted P-loop ATPase
MMRHVAFANPRNPIFEWATSLKWDGKTRIDTWLTYYAGVEDTPYSRLVGRRFLISAMARLLDPGCKVDSMLILEGPQGKGKSAMVRALAGDEWFSDQVGEVTNKDSSQLIQGIWIMEIPEMDKFNRAEANAVKDFLTRTFDRYRPPYGRNVVRRERRCVFFGTINPDGVGYLKDTTGNRRYWPVEVTTIDLAGLAADREQLWAEARGAFLQGERWWIEDDEEAAVVSGEQDARRDDDIWEPKVMTWLKEPERALHPFFTSADVLWQALSVSHKDQGQKEKIRVAKILHMMKCVAKNNQNGISGRSWEIPT